MSRPDQRNSFTMINKSTKKSQSIAKISANTQPNNKATKLSNREEQEGKTSTNHCCSAKLISPNLNETWASQVLGLFST